MKARWIVSSSVIFLYISGVVCLARDGDVRRTKRANPTVYNVYTMDYFIELVEKIEQHPTTDLNSLEHIANFIRKLGYDDQFWNLLLGSANALPDGVLSSDEKTTLTNMVKHQYIGSRELGVVRTRSGDTIAMGPVIKGICAGINRNKRVSLAGWHPDAEDPVDNLFAATIAVELTETGLQKKNNPSRAFYGPGGSWNPNTECPEKYFKASVVTSSASDAQVLGDADGFLLGYNLPRWARKGVRLGQLLRMYYSTGLCYDETFRSCNRYNKLKDLVDEETIVRQVAMLSFAFYAKYESMYPNVKNDDIIGIAKDTTKLFYPYLSCEMPANLVFVMDESGSIKSHNYIKEKDFVKKIIDAVDVSPYQTRVAVVEFSSEARLEIKLDSYGSKSRLKCAVNNLDYKKGSTHTAKAINLVNDDIMTPAQNAATTGESNVKQIMVLLTDGRSNDPINTALERSVTRIKRHIKDLTILTIGVGGYYYPELVMIATDPDKHVFLAQNFDQLIRLVKSIQNRTCTAPVQMEIDFREDANETVISAFVSPDRPRYFVLPSSLFFGIPDVYIDVTPIYGTVAIYASRTDETPGPTSYVHKIDPLSVGETMKLRISDPCVGFNKTTCPPIYLAIYGGDASFTCSERYCTLPSQIKFTIKKGRHSGSNQTSQFHGTFLYIIATLVAIFLANHP